MPTAALFFFLDKESWFHWDYAEHADAVMPTKYPNHILPTNGVKLYD